MIALKRWMVALMAVVVVLAMTGMAEGGTVTVRVGASGSTFSPKTKSVPKGTKVVWKNVSGSHTVTSYSKNWSKNTSLSGTKSTSFTFNKAGVFKYRCTIHSTLSGGVCSGMCGKIVVG